MVAMSAEVKRSRALQGLIVVVPVWDHGKHLLDVSLPIKLYFSEAHF